MGLFVDIFPMDKYHKKSFAFKQEYLFKTIFYYLCKAVDCGASKNAPLIKRMVYAFNPVFRSLLQGYLKQIQSRIRENKKLGSDCLIGHGLDTPWRRFFDYNAIFPIANAPFEGYQFMIPHHSDTYLTTLYGKDYMTPPPVEKRPLRHAVILKPDMTNYDEEDKFQSSIQQ